MRSGPTPHFHGKRQADSQSATREPENTRYAQEHPEPVQYTIIFYARGNGRRVDVDCSPCRTVRKLDTATAVE